MLVLVIILFCLLTFYITRILSIEAAIRYNVQDDRDSVGRVNISKLRTLPIAPK
jgi:hypothetical protein